MPQGANSSVESWYQRCDCKDAEGYLVKPTCVPEQYWEENLCAWIGLPGDNLSRLLRWELELTGIGSKGKALVHEKEGRVYWIPAKYIDPLINDKWGEYSL